MIKLHNVTQRYDSRIVIDIPELVLDDGGRYAVIGANGSGKTTLLRIIAGTLTPSGGSVSLPDDMAANRGYMPQKPHIFGFSVLRNVTMALDRIGQSNRIAAEALEAVGMASFARAKGRSLSGGEAQRVSLARLIAIPRKLMILDEPTSSTDIAGNDLVESAITDYCEKYGCTLIFSTHSPAQAMRLSKEIIMLHNGGIVENGPKETVLNHPVSQQGSDFLQHWKI